MTNNQLMYMANVETKRHNEAMEENAQSTLNERIRSDMANENISRVGLAQTDRHNRVMESIGYKQIDLGYKTLDETSRHNRVTESIQRSNLNEMIRNNKTMNRVALINAQTNARKVHNDYVLGKQSNAIAAARNRDTVNIANMNAQITSAHNRAVETIGAINAGISLGGTMAKLATFALV